MHTVWRKFLEKQDARFDLEDQVLDFGQPQKELEAAAHGTIMSDLSCYGLIRVAGPDVEKFLQGQFSNDIREVSDARAQLSSYSNPKGRMLANFLVHRWQDAYWLHPAGDLSEGLVERLKKYRLMAKVDLEEAGARWVRLGVAGPQAESALAQALGAEAVPPEANASRSQADCTVIRLPWSNTPAFLVMGTAERLQVLWEQLQAQGVHAAGMAPWRLLRIRAGIGLVSAPTAEQFIPQELNLEILGGINFKKGCYPGQEIVARTKYLGRLKSRAYRLESPIAADPGTAIVGTTLEGQAIGQIVDCAPTGRGTYDCLAVLRIDNATEDLRLGSEKGPLLELLDLPYSLPEAS